MSSVSSRAGAAPPRRQQHLAGGGGSTGGRLLRPRLGSFGVAARLGHGKTQRGQKVQRGQNLSDHAQLLTPLSFMYMQRIYHVDRWGNQRKFCPEFIITKLI